MECRSEDGGIGMVSRCVIVLSICDFGLSGMEQLLMNQRRPYHILSESTTRIPGGSRIHHGTRRTREGIGKSEKKKVRTEGRNERKRDHVKIRSLSTSGTKRGS